MGRFLWVLMMLPCAAAADGFVVLSGPQIEDRLSGRSMVFEDGATREFGPSGSTLYNSGRESWGYWVVRGNQYCSQWPPGDGRFCYDVAQDDAERVRFIGNDDSFSTGTFTG